MTFAWQHFKAIEYGYKIEALRTQRNELVDSNRTLRMQQAFLRDPERIDQLARKMGLQTPTAGQVVRMDSATPQNDMPVMASITPVSVISQR
jgi:cell division protein FtsL